MTRTISAFTVGLVIVTALCVPMVVAQQGGTTFYGYDANGRLHVVVSPTGEAAVYEYDAAGNFTAIRRITADTLQLFGFTPTSGRPGDQVAFFGTGFGAGVSSVSFNGTAAQIVSVVANAVTATVPSAATTGLVTIAAAKGAVTTSTPFTVLASVQVFPANAIVLVNQTFQFTAADSVSGDIGVTWSVNDVVGGNSSVGTITQSGLYTAPGQALGSVTIKATSNSTSTISGQAQVRVRDPNNLGAVFSRGVSVGIGLPLVEFVPSRAVSVVIGHLPGDGTAISPAVTVTTGPAISAVSPASLVRGSTTTVTISGANLSGATAVGFFNSDGTQDTAISTAGITPSSDGMFLTLSVTVPSGGSIGLRTVVVATPAGISASQAAGSNTVQIQ
jgi:YD repeat-containing protein